MQKLYHVKMFVFLRPQCPQLPNAKLSQQGTRAKKIDVLPDKYQMPKTQVSRAFVPCTKKECASMASSPSGGVDEDSVDPLEVECTDSAQSESLSLMKSEGIPHF